MKVLFVLALALAQGSSTNPLNHYPAVVPGYIEISHLPVEIAAPGNIQISHLPAEVNAPGNIEISHLPAAIDLPRDIAISHLPAEVNLPKDIEISHLPGNINSPNIGISHLPGQIPVAESTPSCVKYVRALLQEVLHSLPGSDDSAKAPVEPQLPPSKPVQENACTLCFQKLQLLIEKANSRNSNILTF